jgi:TusA-related sulfurtransferase
MHRHLRINLEDIPWPVNVLKFNQALHGLQPGDDMTVTINDKDVLGNLELLLSRQSDLSFDITGRRGEYRIRIKKQSATL